ncbi:MAG: hypothetical protein ACFE9S_08050 [Candidatus Hermodarchaeota archaeon]
MHIFNLHEFSKEPGIASPTIEEINFVTYNSGEETDYFLILMLSILENPENYEAFLTEISQIILKNLSNNKYIDLIPSLYNNILEHSKNREFIKDK